jgi:hypothetical protein
MGLYLFGKTQCLRYVVHIEAFNGHSKLCVWEAQGDQKGLGATPRFALYVARTKPLLLALLIG